MLTLPKLARITVATLALAVAPLAAAKAFDDSLTSAKQAILIDLSTNTVLYEKNADERMPTSSMSKLMTVYMAFDQMKSGRLSMEKELPVSQRAYERNGSDMFLEVGERVKVEDLLRGVIIQSGNDAAITLAEGMGVTEDRFAERMTRLAREELDMKDSQFTNATGWPDPENWQLGQKLNHYSTARDLSRLAIALIRQFPQYYLIYAEKSFAYNGITQNNRNPLLAIPGMGADGLKTGHTEAAGYGLVGSAVRDGRRLVMVINGLPTSKARAQEAERLMDWGFREFNTVTAVQPGQKAGELDVHLGAYETVPLKTDGTLSLTVHMDMADRLEYELIAKSPVPAPVKAGDKLGLVAVYLPGGKRPIGTVPVIAASDVGRADFTGNFFTALGHLMANQAASEGQAQEQAQ